MIKTQIEALKYELNNRIGQGIELKDVYELSVKLDKLILQYYTEERSSRKVVR